MGGSPGTEQVPDRNNARRVLFGGVFLSTGAALLVYVAGAMSLLAAIALAGLVAGGVIAYVWRRADQAFRLRLWRAVQAGAIAGLLATAAYDLFRWLLIEVAGFSFWPFDIFSIFGQALLGAGQAGLWVTLAGFGYHVMNGLCFALAYTVILGRKGVWAGIGWAMALETLQVSVYPGWLEMKALNEFLQVSVFGHFVYGGVLGFVSRRLLERWEVSDRVSP